MLKVKDIALLNIIQESMFDTLFYAKGEGYCTLKQIQESMSDTDLFVINKILIIIKQSQIIKLTQVFVCMTGKLGI